MWECNDYFTPSPPKKLISPSPHPPKGAYRQLFLKIFFWTKSIFVYAFHLGRHLSSERVCVGVDRRLPGQGSVVQFSTALWDVLELRDQPGPRRMCAVLSTPRSLRFSWRDLQVSINVSRSCNLDFSYYYFFKFLFMFYILSFRVYVGKFRS